jgi:hypothetical protein
MAGGDDDIEKLLREVDASLSPGKASAQPVPAAQPGAQPALSARRSALRRATMVGGVWGVGMGGVFLVLPFVHSLSGAVAGFVTGFSVSLAGHWRR